MFKSQNEEVTDEFQMGAYRPYIMHRKGSGYGELESLENENDLKKIQNLNMNKM